MGGKLPGIKTSVFSIAIGFSTALNAVAQSSPEDFIIPPTAPEPIEPTIPQPPATPPEPNLQVPATPKFPGCLPPPENSDRFLMQSLMGETPKTALHRFFIKSIEVLGNTVLHAEINQQIQPFKRRTVAFEDLVCLRSQITNLYIQNGYVTSGAFLPSNQDLSSGVVQIQVVEGELEQIEINGLNHLQPGYVRSRLQRATDTPLNQQRLEEALQLLQLDPLIEQVNAELTVGSTPGQNVLLLDLQEAPAFHAGIAGDNYRSPSIGSNQLNLTVAHDNLLGFGDRLSAQYGLTEGLDIYDIGYSIPVNGMDGTLGFRYSNSDTTIVEDEFEEFDIESETETFSLSFRQPVVRSPQRELALGVSLDLRDRQTFLQGEPFSFSIGAEDGESKVTVLRFFQDWVDRGARRVLAARSQFNVGIDAFDATINDTGTDGQFFAWQGQFQWVQQLSPRTLLIARIGTQLTTDSLLSLEQFSIGGADTVRGYQENQLVTDNGILGSVEVRIPLTADPSVLQLTPFFDIGTGWNNQAPAPDSFTLASLGLGVRWSITSKLGVRLDYGIPLIAVDNQGNSLQENGFHFSVRYQPF